MNKIGFLQVTMIILSSVGLINHVFIIPILLDRSGRDSWISVILIAIPFVLWSSLFYLIMKKSGQQHLIEWIRGKYGRLAGYGVAVAASLYLFFAAAMTIQDTLTWAVTSYLPNTPKVALMLFFVLLCYAASVQGLRVIAILAGILLPGIVALGFFVMSSNMPNKDYTRLFPVLENGLAPVWKGMFICSCGLMELTVLLFMQHYLTRPVRFWQLALVALMLVGLTLGPVTGGIAEFGTAEVTKLRYPAFEEWKLVVLLRNVERLDFLSIYQWLAGAFLRITTSMFLLQEMLNHRRKVPVVRFLLPFYILLGIISVLPVSDVVFYRFLSSIYLPGNLILLAALTILLALLALRIRTRRTTRA